MTEVATAPPDAVTAPDWQRLHPATLLVAILKLGPRSLNFLPAIAALGFTNNWAYIVPAFLLFLLISLLAAWFQWLRFRFTVGTDTVVIESGVFARQHRTIPFDRIQDVSIEQGLVARALGIAKVGFETGASAADDDAQLDAIGLDAAQELRTTIRAHRSEAMAATATVRGDASTVPDEDRLLFAMGPRRLIVAGLFNFSLAALAVVGAATQLLDNFLPFRFNIFNPADWFDLAEQYQLDNWVLAHRWIAGIGTAISLLVIGFASGVAMMMFTNWNFRLAREPRALRRTRGLTTRTDVALPIRRIQAAILVTGWFRKRFGWHELRLQSLASDGGKEADHQIVPFARFDAIDLILDELGIARPPADQIWQYSSPIVALSGLAVAAAVAAGGGIAITLGEAPGWIAITVAALIAGFSLCGVRFHQWADLGDMVAIRRGFWKPRTTLLPHASIQSIDLKTDFILRPMGLATLVFGVPGGSALASHDIPAIPHAAAKALRTRILATEERR
ncbi:MAG: PH domain-containing protein [Sphingopyxis sp.]|uniref:PH domain-containing protein n=1 Tax=Sphingopyxis sp. TaxID=1908224 RepID=UPI002AB8DE66|nr:PH domain-containing protein [Sphingopyxis sp.]MDZ3833280.1 PH domain-containing protein [Sphingopyxis sp.]